MWANRTTEVLPDGTTITVDLNTGAPIGPRQPMLDADGNPVRGPDGRVATEPRVSQRTGEEMGPDTEWEPLQRTKPDGMSDADWNACRADMNRQNWWDMGHTPGNEYRDLLDRYLAGEIDIREFRNEVNNPDNYHVEHPSSNRGGEYEATPRRR